MSSRVVVVGAGILGTMHALAALEQGFEVVHLDRELRARGASTRNFGLVWVSGRASGAELALALRSRALWGRLGNSIPGLPFRPVGSLTVARGPGELALMEEACEMADAHSRQWLLLGREEALAVCPELSGDIAGALYCRADAVVEPRITAMILREYLSGHPGYSWYPGREVVEVGDSSVRDDEGTWHGGERVFLCTGAALSGLVTRYVEKVPVRQVRLQMMETAPYSGRLTTALADGSSMRYYPAYDLPGRAQLPAQPPLAVANGVQLLMVQRADGGLTIGDTHDYDQPFPFDLDETVSAYLLERAASLLRGPLPPVCRRWAGVYCELSPPAAGLYWRHELAPGVEVVTGPGGRGMTCAPGIAEESISRLAPARPMSAPRPLGAVLLGHRLSDGAPDQAHSRSDEQYRQGEQPVAGKGELATAKFLSQ